MIYMVYIYIYVCVNGMQARYSLTCYVHMLSRDGTLMATFTLPPSSLKLRIAISRGKQCACCALNFEGKNCGNILCHRVHGPLSLTPHTMGGGCRDHGSRDYMAIYIYMFIFILILIYIYMYIYIYITDIVGSRYMFTNWGWGSNPIFWGPKPQETTESWAYHQPFVLSFQLVS